MRNIMLILEYDGSRYNGWQRQKNLTRTLQNRIEDILSRMTEEKIELQGAGRTDAGVHALGQVANFHTCSRKKLHEISDYLHKYLPEDINLIDIRDMPDRFHSRLNAIGKIYSYRIWNHTTHNIFNRNYCYHVKKPLHIEKLKQAADLFVGTKNFQSFTALKSKTKSTIRTISKIEVFQKGHEINIEFTGDGFLHKMVRIITGTILQAGLEDITISEIKGMFEKKSRSTAGFTAPPYALFLVKVLYSVHDAI